MARSLILVVTKYLCFAPNAPFNNKIGIVDLIIKINLLDI